jgi:translation initiation factor 2 subunit 3
MAEAKANGLPEQVEIPVEEMTPLTPGIIAVRQMQPRLVSSS